MRLLSGMLMLILVGGGVYGCAAGSATAGYAAKASTCDNISSDGMKYISDTVKAQVVSDMYKEGRIKSDHEVYQMVLEQLKKEGYIK